MPILKDFRNTKTISLPSFPDSQVEIWDSLLVGQMASSGVKESDEKIEQGIKILPLFIKSWNFTDEAGQILPINNENIGFLKEADVTYLLEQISLFSKEGKKKE